MEVGQLLVRMHWSNWVATSARRGRVPSSHEGLIALIDVIQLSQVFDGGVKVYAWALYRFACGLLRVSFHQSLQSVIVDFEWTTTVGALDDEITVTKASEPSLCSAFGCHTFPESIDVKTGCCEFARFAGVL